MVYTGYSQRWFLWMGILPLTWYDLGHRGVQDTLVYCSQALTRLQWWHHIASCRQVFPPSTLIETWMTSIYLFIGFIFQALIIGLLTSYLEQVSGQY